MISPNSNKALNYSELGYSDMGDSFEEMKQRASDKKFPFPYLYDGDEQKTAPLLMDLLPPRIVSFLTKIASCSMPAGLTDQKNREQVKEKIYEMQLTPYWQEACKNSGYKSIRMFSKMVVEE